MMVTLMALSAPMVYADNGGDKDSWKQDGDWQHAKHEHMTAKILNLSETQEKQLKDIRHKQKEAMRSTFEQMKADMVAFEAEIIKAAPDMSKVNDIQAKLKTIQSQMVDQHLSSILEIKKVLTPEQFAGYMALEREEDMMEHHGHHHPGPKDGMDKDRESHEHWGDKSNKDDEPDGQD